MREHPNRKGFVFIFLEKDIGYPIYVKHVDYRMSRILKFAGLDEGPTPHSLRHTHASLCAEAGVPLHEKKKPLKGSATS
ncbi:tyrosine-type recombinase/integrase [Syntrophobotulus glycolicus]|uniref:tyrosine-type recombinase/integrase n=1 Tax=Syntrophobotulus glycolicus TaxID=51197 RepID=UPI003D01C2A4